VARDSRVSFLVDDFVADRIDVLARQMGLTKSALCAYVMGNYVYMQDRVMVQMLDAIGGSIKQLGMQELQLSPDLDVERPDS
jgi:hypothetical protein